MSIIYQLFSLSTASAVDHRIPKNYLHLLLFNRLSTASAVDHRIMKEKGKDTLLNGLSTASAVDHRIPNFFEIMNIILSQYRFRSRP